MKKLPIPIDGTVSGATIDIQRQAPWIWKPGTLTYALRTITVPNTGPIHTNLECKVCRARKEGTKKRLQPPPFNQ